MVENNMFPHLWIARVNCNNVSFFKKIKCKKCSEKDNLNFVWLGYVE
jgi:hypothetical protein